MKRIYKEVVLINLLVMKDIECSNQAACSPEDSILLSYSNCQKGEIWTTRTDYLKRSNRSQEMKWFKGSRNRSHRILTINDLAA